MIASIRVWIERLTGHNLTHAYLHQQGFAGLGTDAISACCEASACEQRQVGHVGPTSPACMNFLDKVSAWDAGGKWERSFLVPVAAP